MENDAVAHRTARHGLWACTALLLGLVAWPQGAAAGPGPSGGTTGSPPPWALPTGPRSPLPPMLAQAAPPQEDDRIRAEPAPPGSVPSADQPPLDSRPSPASSPPAPAAKPAPRPADSASCESDRECPAGSVCIDGACQSVRKRVSALIYYHQPGPIGYRMVVPFYFSFWRPERSTRVLVPFFSHHKDQTNQSSDLFIFPLLYQRHRTPEVDSHRVWPLFFYSNFGKQGSGIGLMPLFYGQRRGPSTLAVLPLLLTFYSGNTQTRASDLLAAGLVYHRRRGDATTLVLPLLLTFSYKTPTSAAGMALALGWWRRSGDDFSAGVFPLGWHFASKRGHTTVGLPLFVEGADHERGLRHVTLFPLFHYRSEGRGARKLLVTPLGGWHVDRERSISTGALLVPPLIHREEPRYRITLVPPVFLSYRNKETGRHTGYAGPAFWSTDDEGSTVGLFPLYVRFHNRRPDATTQIFFPVAALHNGPRRSLGVVGPIFGWRSKEPGGGGGGGVFPLLWFASGRRSYAMVLPLFAYDRDRDAGRLHVSVGPFFYRSRQLGPADQRGYDTGLLPLLFIGRRGDTQYQTLLPVFYHRKDARKEHLVLGPAYFVRTFASRPGDPEAGFSAGLFPLLWFKRSPQRSHAVIAPIFWYAREGARSVGVLGPVFWQRDRGPDGPRGSGGLLPLFYVRHTPTQRLFLSPIAGYYHDRQSGDRVVAAGPFWHVRQGNAGTSTTALLPIAFFYRGKDRSADVLFPLFIQGREGGTTVRSAALLYWGVRTKDLSAHVLAPLFAHVSTGRGSTTVVGPFFHHGRRDGSARAFGALPLFAYLRNERATQLYTPLGFYYHDRKDEHTRTTFLLYYGDYRKGRSDWGIFPLLFGVRRGTASAVLGPLFYHSRDPATPRALTVIGPLYFGHRGTATFGGLLPLVFGRNDGRGGYRFTAVPLFHLDHDPSLAGRTRLFTLLFGFRKAQTGYLAYVGPFYLRRDPEVRSEALFPLFYHAKDMKSGVSTSLFLPLFFQRRSTESTLTAVTPLFWLHQTLTQRTVLLFPFALDIHRFYQSRITAVGPLVPLFIRSRSYADDSTAWIFPPLLTYVKRHAEGHDAVVFPLFWHYPGKERATTVVLPIFYHLKRPDYRASVLIPFYFYFKDEKGSMLIIPPLLTYARSHADGRRTVLTFPIYYASSSPTEQSRVVFPFYWYNKRPGMERTIFAPVGAYWKTDRARHLLVLNSYTAWGVGPRKGAWEFHFWPLFSFGRPRRFDLEWNVLGGLLGYSRLGVHRTFKLLWGVQIPLEPVGARSAWYGATLRMSADLDRPRSIPTGRPSPVRALDRLVAPALGNSVR